MGTTTQWIAWVLFAVGIGGIGAPRAAGATGDPPIEGEPKAPPSFSWYGYQTLAVDGVAVALAILGERNNSDGVMLTGGGLYLLGAPAVHGLHRRTPAMLGSLGLRIFLPVIVSAVAGATADCRVQVVNDENCDFGERLVGAGIGLGAAMLLDAALLAWETGTVATTKGRMPSPPSRTLSLSPVLSRGGAGLALGGLF
jgi:hypothetical protein